MLHARFGVFTATYTDIQGVIVTRVNSKRPYEEMKEDILIREWRKRDTRSENENTTSCIFQSIVERMKSSAFAILCEINVWCFFSAMKKIIIIAYVCAGVVRLLHIIWNCKTRYNSNAINLGTVIKTWFRIVKGSLGFFSLYLTTLKVI